MSSVLKKDSADRMAFKHHPKAFQLEATDMAKDFVSMQSDKKSDFHIAEVVAAQSGIQAIQKKNIEAQVEGTVLERLKEMEEKAYAQAYELGLHEGHDKAFEDSRADLHARLEKFDQFLLLLENLKVKILKENEAAIVQLIYQIASRIAMREIKMLQHPIVELLNELVQEVQGAENIVVKVNPDDLKYLEELRAKNVKEVEKLTRVQLNANPSIETGGCIMETNYGIINATIQKRVEKAWAVLEAKLPSIREEPTST
jgi:flagellar assembly protein FliH